MRIRITILVIVVGVIMILTQPAIADDLADLKAAHQMYDKAWNTGNVAGAFEQM